MRIEDQVPRHGEVRLPGGRGEPVKTYGDGRICAAPGCMTVLSRYNPSEYCAHHSRSAGAAEHRQRRDAPLLTRRCAYEPCGRTFTTSNAARKYCCDRCRMRAFQRRQRLVRVA